jgi:hypothetical protein
VYRNVLMMSAAGLLVAIAATPLAAQSGDRSYRFPMPSNPRSPLGIGPTNMYAPPAEMHRTVQPNKWQVAQLVRWSEVGKCVVARDRDASFSYVVAPPGSPAALAAAEALKPVFATCFKSAGIAQEGNKGYRRAAIADALGVRPSGAS